MSKGTIRKLAALATAIGIVLSIMGHDGRRSTIQLAGDAGRALSAAVVIAGAFR